MPSKSPSPSSSSSSESSNGSATEHIMLKPANNGLNITVFEDVFDHIRQYGKYQLFMLVVIQYAMLNAAGNYVFMSFASLAPMCDDPMINELKNPCEIVARCPANQTHAHFNSLYTDAAFICPIVQLPHHMQTLQAIGSGIGAIVGGHMADIFGRKWVTYAGAVQTVAFGLTGAFAVNWAMLAAAMFGMGLAYGALVDASMTLASETVGPKYRIVQTLAFQWSLALIVSSSIAYFTGSWRSYLLAVNLICLPVLGLMLLWRESPRWLIQKKQYHEAAKELNSLAKWNGTDVRFTENDLLVVEVASEHGTDKVYSLWHLVANKKLVAYSVVMALSALTVEMCVAVIILDVQILAGNPFVNVALYGILRLWVPFFIVFIETKGSTCLGRRTLFVGSQATTALCYLAVLFLSTASVSSSTGVAKTVIAMIGGIINSSIFFTVYKQYSIELYPTLMRAMAVGTFGVIERVGGGLAPQLVAMNKWAWPGSALAVTAFVLILSAIAGAIVLPETRNARMPDTVDGEAMATVAEKKISVRMAALNNH
uniref:MFS domain-containing protein n=1 Tax=Panagrellus redivivus TaxID=6233 RepID=A0A7E4VH11_PANRE